MRNRHGIFWGIFLLIGAGILVASQMHLITYAFSFWSIFLTIILVAVMIRSIISFSIGGIVFPLAFLAIIFAKPLGITALVPWTVLGAALLITIGLSLIFYPAIARRRMTRMRLRHHGYAFQGPHHGNFRHDFDIETVEESDADINVRMGNSVRYIKSDDFKVANISVNMGNAKVYFDNVTVNDTAEINIDVSLGGLDLYIPSSWNLEQEIDDSSISGIEEIGRSNATSESPTVKLRGYVSMSGVKINYI